MPEPSRPDPEIAALRKAQFPKPMPDPYRSTSATWALRRAQILVHGPLLLAMAVMVLAGWRIGLSVYGMDDVTATESTTFPFESAVSFSVFVFTITCAWIGFTIHAHQHEKGSIVRWMVACAMSLVLGLTLGSWPDERVTDCGQLATPSDRGGGENGGGGS